jgi:hypothetical protein
MIRARDNSTTAPKNEILFVKNYKCAEIFFVWQFNVMNINKHFCVIARLKIAVIFDFHMRCSI